MLRADLSRAECNRDMWKEQCARQAEQLETGILRLNAEQAQVEGLRLKAERYDWLREHAEIEYTINGTRVLAPIPRPPVRRTTGEEIDAAIDSARAGREGGNGR